VIKKKLLAFTILTTWISLIFLVAIAAVNNDLRLVWLGSALMAIAAAALILLR
jgi:hypothetical protein